MTNKKLQHSEDYNDGKYKIMSIEGDEGTHWRRIVCKTDGICIIPYDTSGKQIRNIYLAKFEDYLSGDSGHTCITSDLLDTDSTMYERIDELIKNELGIDLDIDDLYLLGSISHNLPFSKTYKCYGLCLDNYSKDLNGFSLDLSDSEKEKMSYTLDKVRFTRLLNGDIDDSLCLSGSLLLTSYIN
jgi:hypothetical protein